jgi:hypothetical protein
VLDGLRGESSIALRSAISPTLNLDVSIRFSVSRFFLTRTPCHAIQLSLSAAIKLSNGRAN